RFSSEKRPFFSVFSRFFSDQLCGGGKLFFRKKMCFFPTSDLLRPDDPKSSKKFSAVHPPKFQNYGINCTKKGPKTTNFFFPGHQNFECVQNQSFLQQVHDS